MINCYIVYIPILRSLFKFISGKPDSEKLILKVEQLPDEIYYEFESRIYKIMIYLQSIVKHPEVNVPDTLLEPIFDDESLFPLLEQGEAALLPLL